MNKRETKLKVEVLYFNKLKNTGRLKKNFFGRYK